MLDIFFDTNVIMASLLEAFRSNLDALNVEAVQRLWQALREGKINGFMAGFALPTVFSLAEGAFKDKYRRAGWNWQQAEKQARRDAFNLVNDCTNTFYICELYRSDVNAVTELMRADLACTDFEDNLQLSCAYGESIGLLVTFNKRDFNCAAKFEVEAVTPIQCLARLSE